MSKGKIVTFRLANEHYALLEAKASGTSPNIYARELTLQGLHSEKITEPLNSQLNQHKELIQQLNRNLFRVCCAFLIAFAKIDPEKACSWARRIFR